MDFINVCKCRYSCRSFSAYTVDHESMYKIFEAGRLAPTAKNRQPQRIFVIKSGEALARLREATELTYGAPLVFMVCYDEHESYKNEIDTHFPHYDGGEVDAAIVTTMMMMEAVDLGYATLWVRGFDSQRIYDLFPEIKDYHLVSLLCVGCDRELFILDEDRAPRKEWAETVRIL